jgi:hypothetical protein
MCTVTAGRPITLARRRTVHKRVARLQLVGRQLDELHVARGPPSDIGGQIFVDVVETEKVLDLLSESLFELVHASGNYAGIVYRIVPQLFSLPCPS